MARKRTAPLTTPEENACVSNTPDIKTHTGVTKGGVGGEPRGKRRHKHWEEFHLWCPHCDTYSREFFYVESPPDYITCNSCGRWIPTPAWRKSAFDPDRYKRRDSA